MGRAIARRGARALCCRLAFMLAWAGALLSTPSAPLAAQNTSGRVPILAYHAVDYSGSTYSVNPEQLDAQCQWLVANGYTVITLGQFWDAAMGSGALPPNPVMLTNDDGYPSAMTFAEIIGRYGFSATYFVNNVSALTPDQIRVLSQLGSVEAHTVNHAHLASLGYEGQVAEIAQNKAYLEQITGQPVYFLAWPFAEWNDSAVQAAAASGIVGAFSLGGIPAYVGAIDPYHISRIYIGTSDDLASFAAKVSG